MELSMLSNYFKAAAARWFLQLAAGSVSSELEELGIDMRRGAAGGGLGLGNATRRNWMRAEWAGFNLK